MNQRFDIAEGTGVEAEQVVVSLQVHPEFRSGAKRCRQTVCHGRADGSLASNDFSDCGFPHADGFGEAVVANSSFRISPGVLRN